MKSFYQVELAMSGGVYRDERYTYGKLTDLQQALDFEFWTDLRGDDRCVLWYGGIPLETYIKGERKQQFNLEKFIAIRSASGTDYSLKTEVDWDSVVKKHTPGLAKGAGLPPGAYDAFFASALFYIDWGAIPLMELEEPVLKAGEMAFDDDDPDVENYTHGVWGEGLEDEDFRERMAEVIAVDPKWLKFNGGTIPAMAESMHKTGDYSAMPILADALQEAGCENELFLWHCRAPACVHAGGSWLVELLRQPGPKAKKAAVSKKKTPAKKRKRSKG